MYYKKKPQSFAGPVGLQLAIDNGANLQTPFSIHERAYLYTKIAWLYALVLEWPIIGKWMRQHLNSMWLAHLLVGKKPPKNLLWTARYNPFYSYIAGIKMDVEIPPDTRYTNGYTIERKYVVRLCERKPSSWIWRNWPKSEYMPEGKISDWSYTPIAYLAAKYFQETL
jgi:hypothetical protein